VNILQSFTNNASESSPVIRELIQEEYMNKKFTRAQNNAQSSRAAFIGLLLVLASVCFAQTNLLVQNPDFESYLQGWTINGSAATTSSEYRDSKVCEIYNEGGVSYNREIIVQGRQSITLSFLAKIESPVHWAGVGIDFLDANGVEISEVYHASFSTTDFRTETITATLPPATHSLALWTYKSGADGKLLLDDFSLTASGGTGAFEVVIDYVSELQCTTYSGPGWLECDGVWNTRSLSANAGETLDLHTMGHALITQSHRYPSRHPFWRWMSDNDNISFAEGSDTATTATVNGPDFIRAKYLEQNGTAVTVVAAEHGSITSKQYLYVSTSGPNPQISAQADSGFQFLYWDKIYTDSGCTGTITVDPVQPFQSSTFLQKSQNFYCTSTPQLTLTARFGKQFNSGKTSEQIAVTGSFYTLSYSTETPIKNDEPITVLAEIMPNDSALEPIYSEVFPANGSTPIHFTNTLATLNLGSSLSTANLSNALHAQQQAHLQLSVFYNDTLRSSEYLPLRATAWPVARKSAIQGQGVPPSADAEIGTMYINTLEQTTYLRIASGWMRLD